LSISNRCVVEAKCLLTVPKPAFPSPLIVIPYTKKHY